MDISYCDDKTGFPRPGHIFLVLRQTAPHRNLWLQFPYINCELHNKLHIQIEACSNINSVSLASFPITLFNSHYCQILSMCSIRVQCSKQYSMIMEWLCSTNYPPHMQVGNNLKECTKSLHTMLFPHSCVIIMLTGDAR